MIGFTEFGAGIRMKQVNKLITLFSSPEPKAPGELIVQAGSVIRRRPSTISNDFSETTGPIVNKFYM